MFSRSPRAYYVLLFDWAGAFLIAQGTLLVFRHLRRVFIKFLRLSVPHVLLRDANATAKDFVRNRARILSLLTLSLV